ncbi:MAG TPA: DUF2231 domain-containing protein [Pseudonocardia sp.]|nr:DUF2231 domain-containing protein [Pseudonocardia sp.]
MPPVAGGVGASAALARVLVAMDIQRLLSSTEDLRQVDGPAAAASAHLRRVLGGTRTDRFLRGSWLGHPVHPLLVTVPIGAWTGAAVLDGVPGQQEAARRLVGLGVAFTAPAVIAGLADWSALDTRQRRVGVVHAATNAVAAACFAVSYRRRGQGKHAAGAAWGLAGLTWVGIGGALGGHLSYALGAGVGRWQ